jgi:hypothetical protein
MECGQIWQLDIGGRRVPQNVHGGVRRGDSDGTMTRNGRILEDHQRFPGFDFDASPQRVSDFFWRHLS